MRAFRLRILSIYEAYVNMHEAQVSMHETRINIHEAQVNMHKAHINMHEARVNALGAVCICPLVAVVVGGEVVDNLTIVRS